MTAIDIPIEERSPELALKTFTFVKSSGSAAAKEACAATMLAWLRGDKWTDHPECAHPMICDAVIRGNDYKATTTEQQKEIFLAGIDGMLGTWWVPTQVVLAAVAGAPKEASPAEFALFVEGAVAAWKAAPDKERPDLYGANLGSADLRSANLGSADLRSANLRSANLGSANLRSADLRSANLGSADLRSANLGSADLRSADLRSANLYGADLGSANLGATLGDSLTRLPSGWKVSESGLVVKD